MLHRVHWSINRAFGSNKINQTSVLTKKDVIFISNNNDMRKSIIVLFLFFSACAMAQTADDIINKHIEGHGRQG